jgi:predicted aldo/keto reductase-like oxidoreductase
LKWALNHEFVTTAIPGFSTYEHLEQDFSVARNLAYTREEEKFLADKSFAAQAEFCQQCGECKKDCPKQVDIPLLMRSHMYAVQYRNPGMAQAVLAATSPGHGLDACGSCASCQVACRNTVPIARKIDELRTLAGGPLRA